MAVKTKVVQRQKTIKSIISKSTLVDELLKIEKTGATFCKAKSIIEPRMNKRNNPFYGKIFKKSEIIAIINFDYENNVNNARIKTEKFETKFEAKERKWGHHMFNPHTRKYSRIMIEHTDKSNKYKNYVQVRILKTNKPIYFYKNNNKILNKNEIKQLKEFFPKRQKNKTQGLNQENEIIVRDYTLENVVAMNLNKRKFIIR